MAENHPQNPTASRRTLGTWLDENFKDGIVVVIALTTVLAGVVAVLENRAGHRYAEMIRLGQALSMDALGHEVSSSQEENYDFYLYTTWQEWQKRYEWAEGEDQELAARARNVADIIAPLTPLLDESSPYLIPATETTESYVDLYAYHVDTNLVETTELLEKRLFAIEAANIWNGKSDGYVTILTVITVALFLYGLSSTIAGAMRYLFAAVGTLLVGVAVVSMLLLALRPVPGIPEEAIAHYAQGVGLAYMGKSEEALASFDAALEAYPDYGKAYAERAGVHYGLQDYAAAVQDCLDAIEKGRADRVIYGDLGWTYYLLGDYAASLEASRHAQELDPELLPVVMNIGMALLASGETEAAMEQYEQALAIAADPNSAVPASWNHRFLRWAIQDLDRLLAALDGQTDFADEPDLSHVGDRTALRAAAETARRRIKEGTVAIEAAQRPYLEPTGTNLSSLTFARYVGPRGELLGEGDTFARGDLAVVVALQFDNLPQGAIISRRVTREWLSEPGFAEDLPTMGQDLAWDGPSQGTWQHVMNAPWPGDRGFRPGRYDVEYYVNGHLLQSGSFSIPESETSIIGPIVFAAECGSGGIAGAPAGLFPRGQEKLYGIVSHSGVPAGTIVHETWYRNGDVYYSRETDAISGWGSYCFLLEQAPPGDYLLELTMEGQADPVQAATFQVFEIDDYVQAISTEPQDPLFHLNLGDAYAYTERYEEAAARYQKAIDVDPRCAECYYHWWSILDEQEQYAEAAQKLQTAVELNPKEYEYTTALGETYYNLGDDVRAEAAYRQVVGANPSWVLNAWANALYNLEQYEEAALKYALSLELDPEDEVVYANMGVAYRKLGEYDKAIAAFEQAIALDPSYARAYNEWGDALYDQDRYAEAALKYQQARDLDPEKALYVSNLGWAHYRLAEYEQARDFFQQAVDLAPWSAIYYANLGMTNLELGAYDQAAAAFEQAVELDPHYDWAYSQWGDVLYAQERFEEAADKYRQAAELAPDNASHHLNLGVTYYLLGEDDLAIEALQRAAELNPESAGAYNVWGHILYDRGDYQGAAEKYGRSVELVPEAAIYHYNLGLALYQLGENDQAAAQFELAAQLAAEEGDEALRQDAEEMLEQLR
jgi:tetratricopeptide (TPR) repeat protein